MKANTSALMRKGYTTGVLSGMTWGLDTVLIHSWRIQYSS